MGQADSSKVLIPFAQEWNVGPQVVIVDGLGLKPNEPQLIAGVRSVLIPFSHRRSSGLQSTQRPRLCSAIADAGQYGKTLWLKRSRLRGHATAGTAQDMDVDGIWTIVAHDGATIAATATVLKFTEVLPVGR